MHILETAKFLIPSIIEKSPPSKCNPQDVVALALEYADELLRERDTY